MNTEEKARRYDEALEKMRKMFKPWSELAYNGKTFLQDLKHIFPELSESEDEEIRKEIISIVKEYGRICEKEGDPCCTISDCLAYLEKQKEQKPNIELIQRSWYMEGYHDREFGKEPKWVIKTGEGGPKHELNPRYGQPLTEQRPTDTNIPEQKPAEWGFKGRRGRIGDTPEHIRKKAENFLSKFEPPYDADDICSAYETGAMESIKLHDRVPDLSDGYLLEELRRRGYKGKLAKVQEVEI